jgi:CRP-like cAMP-binding protein
MDGIRSRCDLHRRWHIRLNRSVRNVVLANRQQIKAVTAANQDYSSPVIAPDHLQSSFEAGSTIRALAPGEVLFRQGDPAAAIYKVESGRLRLIRRTVDDHLVILHTARRGEFFAEASLFADAYHCDAVAAAQSSVRVYQKEIVINALRTGPALAEAFMARLARQPQELRARMELRNIRSARDRVLQYLRLSAGIGGRSVALDGQLQDIAAEIGITREVLYRTLAALETEGHLTRTETAILLKNSDSV